MRGKGLLVGLELVKNPSTKVPAQSECAAALEHAREMGLLPGKGGLWGQTIRLAPPMRITPADREFIAGVPDAAFARLWPGSFMGILLRPRIRAT